MTPGLTGHVLARCTTSRRSWRSTPAATRSCSRAPVITLFTFQHGWIADVFAQENSVTRRSPPRSSFRAGKDATADFVDIGHSDSAKEMMPQYCIGEVDAATVPAKLTYAYASDASPDKAATSAAGAWATLLRLAVPVLLLTLALAMQSYGKAKAE